MGSSPSSSALFFPCSLSLSLLLCLSYSSFSLSLSPSLSLSHSLPHTVSLSVCMSVFLSVCLSVWLSVCLSRKCISHHCGSDSNIERYICGTKQGESCRMKGHKHPNRQPTSRSKQSAAWNTQATTLADTQVGHASVISSFLHVHSTACSSFASCAKAQLSFTFFYRFPS